jgi:hypothetical protein
MLIKILLSLLFFVSFSLQAQNKGSAKINISPKDPDKSVIISRDKLAEVVAEKGKIWQDGKMIGRYELLLKRKLFRNYSICDINKKALAKLSIPRRKHNYATSIIVEEHQNSVLRVVPKKGIRYTDYIRCNAQKLIERGLL